jgi:hypothetical protein
MTRNGRLLYIALKSQARLSCVHVSRAGRRTEHLPKLGARPAELPTY